MAKRRRLPITPRNGRSLLPAETLEKMEQVYQGALAVCRKYNIANINGTNTPKEEPVVQWRKRARKDKKEKRVHSPRANSKRGRASAYLAQHVGEDAEQQAQALAGLAEISVVKARRWVRKYAAGQLEWAKNRG